MIPGSDLVRSTNFGFIRRDLLGHKTWHKTRLLEGLQVTGEGEESYYFNIIHTHWSGRMWAFTSLETGG